MYMYMYMYMYVCIYIYYTYRYTDKYDAPAGTPECWYKDAATSGLT